MPIPESGTYADMINSLVSSGMEDYEVIEYLSSKDDPVTDGSQVEEFIRVLHEFEPTGNVLFRVKREIIMFVPKPIEGELRLGEFYKTKI